MGHGDPVIRVGEPKAAGRGCDGRAVHDGRPGGQAMSDASRRAAREGVGRGLRALYADSLDEPLSDDLRALVGRFGAAMT